MKILVLCYEFPPLGGGGARVVYGLSQELVRLGHEVDIVTMGFRGLPAYEEVHGARVYRVPCLRTRISVCYLPEMLTYLVAAAPLVRKLVRTRRYDVNHTHFIYPDGVLAFALKKLTGLPFVMTAHGSDVPGYNPHRFKLTHRLLLPVWRAITQEASHIVFPSQNLQSLYRQYGSNGNLSVVPNGINLATCHSTPQKHKRILVVTRMFERKGVQYFLRALAGMSLEDAIHIVGDGPYLATLRSLAEELKVRVHFHGWLESTSPQFQALYATSSIFVFPSIQENFPMVLLEAMAHRMAIITTQGTGCAEVVGDTALLVEAGDIQGIREALRKLTGDRELCWRMGESARKRLDDNFTWPAVAQQYIRILAQ